MSGDRGSGHRVQVTVFLEAQVHQAAKKRAGDMKLSLSATIAEAAKESLLSSYRSERELELLKAAERNFYALKRMEQRVRLELAVLKELVGLGMRSFFNHTPPVPEPNKGAALLSGKQRFGRYLDLVATNLRGGQSILGDVPLPEPAGNDGDDKTPRDTNSPTHEPMQGPPHGGATDRATATTRRLAEPMSDGDQPTLFGQSGT